MKFKLTTEHPSSSYGIPVLLDEDTGEVYGKSDKIPSGATGMIVVMMSRGMPGFSESDCDSFLGR